MIVKQSTYGDSDPENVNVSVERTIYSRYHSVDWGKETRKEGDFRMEFLLERD